jgi:hypothetical protein
MILPHGTNPKSDGIFGRDSNMSAWLSDLKGDCPKRDGRLNDRCDLVCPDLSKVL